LALRRAAVSGNAKFFLGTDSAPHPVHDKERDCGCAGIFSAPVALETYVQVFDEENALDRFEAFASLNGPRFYRLKPNEQRITLRRRVWTAPIEMATGAGPVRPFRAGEPLSWQLAP
jgi:dihydroorotase